MGFLSPLFLLGFSIIISTFLERADSAVAAGRLGYVCSNSGGNYTANSTYSTNLNHLFSSVTITNTLNNNHGFFYNYSTGNNSNTVNAIAVCRGDIKPDDCINYISNATTELRNLCPNQKEAIIWYDFIMLRYSNRSIFGHVETDNTFYILYGATDPDGFNQVLSNLLDNLTSTAASSGSLRKYATGNASAPDFQTIYGLVQCTPDLSEQQCNDCLVGYFQQIPQCCNGRQGAWIVGPSCYFRYEVYRFYDPTLSLTTPPPSQPPQPPVTNTTTPPEGEDTNSSTTIIIVVVSVVSVLILAVCIYICLRRRSKQNDETMDDISWEESLQYDLSTIRIATDNFSDQNKLGQGGFGAVYKGRLINGQEVAVKRLAIGSGQGDLEFKNEVLLVAKLQHRNLVRLLGYCLAGQERILVYEFVLNTSLDNFIFDPVKRAKLDWKSRSKIIRGVARGLLYLHEDSRLRIIHRDLKASNVLLDAEMNPKIADFGMARLFDQMDETQIYTDRIVGTYGYMAPEFAMHGQFSVKADVYSFGVLVLEIVSGQKNNCCRQGQIAKDLLSLAWRNWREETVPKLFDPTMKMGSRNEMARCVHVALLCVQENVADRPTMGSVLLMLNSTSLSLQLPSQPTLGTSIRTLSDMSSSLNSQTTDSKGSASETLPLSKNEVTITSLRPR